VTIRASLSSVFSQIFERAVIYLFPYYHHHHRFQPPTLMPGKHVRFAETNILYSPLPSTPSPLNETSSLPSCSPVLVKDTSLLEEPDSSPTVLSLSPETFVQLHPILQFSLNPAIDFDISFPPTSITAPHHHALADSAVNPPLACLALIFPYLPWPITVTPALQLPESFVTVADVLVALHRALRLAVHPDEYNALPSHEDKHKVNASYKLRYIRITDPVAHEEEKRKGVKRVDFLMGRTRFLGLSPTSVGPGIWAMNLA
jgi:hypothetical protein